MDFLRNSLLHSLCKYIRYSPHGEVAEWSKAHAWKVCRRETVSRVRIPVSPPFNPEKAFSRSGCGRIFPLFWRVMRGLLLTGLGAKRPAGCLSGPLCSGPVDCVRAVQLSKIMKNICFSGLRNCTFVVCDRHAGATRIERFGWYAEVRDDIDHNVPPTPLNFSTNAEMRWYTSLFWVRYCGLRGLIFGRIEFNSVPFSLA